MPNFMLLTVALFAGGLGAAPVDAQAPSPTSISGRTATPSEPQGGLQYTPVARLAEKARQTVFADVSTCHSDIRKKSESLYPEQKLGSRGYSPKEDVKAFRARSRFENAGATTCDQQMLQKHTLIPTELREIKIEGACKQWPPLTGKPGC